MLFNRVRQPLMFDIKKLILSLRLDLCEKFGFRRKRNLDLFLSWLIISGVKEYASLIDDTKFIQFLDEKISKYRFSLTKLQYLIYKARSDVRTVFKLPADRDDYLVWFYTHGLLEHGYWNYLTDLEKKVVLQMPEPWRSRLKPVINEYPRKVYIAKPFSRRKFGTNLIGYAFGQLGIGEDVRMAGRAMMAVNVPMTMMDFPPGAEVGNNDLSMAAHVSETAEYAFNIFCLTALENGRFYAERGRAQFAERYNIGYWPWELSAWPKDWRMMIELVDEVWVSTQHTYDSLKSICDKPLYLMPMAVELGPVKKFGSRAKIRRHFGLPVNAQLFCFSFDLKSYVDRKNPQACVDAFLKAFPKNEFDECQVGLVIKVHKPSKPDAVWTKLKRLAAKDKRIHIIESTLSRPELLALYQSCNCYLSLHRAEGFGRGLAEALQLGLHVICTGYSGNVDFCQPPQADLVRYKLVRIRKGQYPYASGQVWAEPNIDHAASLMRKFVLDNKRRAPTLGIERFSTAEVGLRYKNRLKEIWAERKNIKLQFSASV